MMPDTAFYPWLEWISRELLLFTAACFFIGALDDFLIDLGWLGVVGARSVRKSPKSDWQGGAQQSQMAVLLPAWQESAILPATVTTMAEHWADADYRLYIGCYPNDDATRIAAEKLADGYPNVRVVICDRSGPTSKADCLNQIWRVVQGDYEECGQPPAGVMLQDAEDIVHPDALALVERALSQYDFVQIPVIPLRDRRSRWVAGHYGDEFAEMHAKQLVFRDALGAALPGAGVGCAVAYDALCRLADEQGGAPFDADSLTEDYELGLRLTAARGKGAFLRCRDASGHLIATREYFPVTLSDAVRQKARWLTGIALAGWDRMGWSRSPLDNWMRLRDRKASFAALILAMAYFTALLWGFLLLLEILGYYQPAPFSPVLRWLLMANFFFLCWRLLLRALFVWRAYGLSEALLSVPRMFIANLINIMAGRRAAALYLKSLWGRALRWEKTRHDPGCPKTTVVPVAKPIRNGRTRS